MQPYPLGVLSLGIIEKAESYFSQSGWIRDFRGAIDHQNVYRSQIHHVVFWFGPLAHRNINV